MCYYDRTHVRLLQEGNFLRFPSVKESLYYQHFFFHGFTAYFKVLGSAPLLLSCFLDMTSGIFKLSRKGVVTDPRQPTPCLHNAYNVQVWNIFFRSSIDNIHTVPYYLIISCAFYELDYRLSWISRQYESCVICERNTWLPGVFLVTGHCPWDSSRIPQLSSGERKTGWTSVKRSETRVS